MCQYKNDVEKSAKAIYFSTFFRVVASILQIDPRNQLQISYFFIKIPNKIHIFMIIYRFLDIITTKIIVYKPI
jgi:hypothetical protein